MNDNTGLGTGSLQGSLKGSMKGRQGARTGSLEGSSAGSVQWAMQHVSTSNAPKFWFVPPVCQVLLLDEATSALDADR